MEKDKNLIAKWRRISEEDTHIARTGYVNIKIAEEDLRYLLRTASSTEEVKTKLFGENRAEKTKAD